MSEHNSNGRLRLNRWIQPRPDGSLPIKGSWFIKSITVYQQGFNIGAQQITLSYKIGEYGVDGITIVNGVKVKVRLSQYEGITISSTSPNPITVLLDGYSGSSPEMLNNNE